MALQNDTSRIQYNGNNSTTNSYAIPFVFFENSHIKCVVTTSAGVDTELTLGSTFNVTGAGNANGGSLTTTTAVPATSKVTIFRNVPATQTTSYQEGGDFPAASHERALDKLTMIAQQTKRLADRALKVPETQNNPNDLPNAGTGQKLLSSNNGTLAWEENRNPPPYPATAGTQALVTAGSGASPSWQTIPSIATGPITATGSNTPRMLGDRFADRISVIDFGADPTGATSSRNAFIAALAAVANNGTIFIPKGTYSGLYGIDVSKSISIIGDGDDSTTLDTPDIGNYIFRLLTGCNKFVCRGVKIQWEGGYTATAGGGSRCITNDTGNVSSTNLEVLVDSCTFRNFSESITLWREKAKRLEVTNCKFAYKHGYVSCRFSSGGPTNNIYTSPSAGWTIIGNAKTTILKNNEWNGLEDPTFTGAASGLPTWVYTPIDNFYKGGGRAYDLLIIENNYVRNFGVEGIIVDRYPQARGTWDDVSSPTYTSRAIIHGNTFIGPQKSTARGVTPAISLYSGNSISVRNNFIDGTWVGVSTHGTGYTATCSAAANTITYSTGNNAENFWFDSLQNGKVIYITYLPENHGTGIAIDTPYYVRNAQARSGNTLTFQISTTPTGGVVDILANSSNIILIPKDEWENQHIVIAGNTITNCIAGVGTSFGLTSRHVLIEGNNIQCASEPCKTSQGYYFQDTTQSPPPVYTDLRPIDLYSSATLRNNYLSIMEPVWDGVFTLVSRSGVNSNIMTLAAGEVAQIAAAAKQATINGNLVTDYGFFQVWNTSGQKSHRWPIEFINVGNNTVQVYSGWATNNGADAYTNGPLYWTKTGGTNGAGGSYLAAITVTGGADQTVYSYNDVITDAVIDVRAFGFQPSTVILEGTKVQSLRAGVYNANDIRRFVESSTLKILTGSGSPTITAPDGSLYLRTDGDASTLLYVRAAGTWTPLASWNP